MFEGLRNKSEKGGTKSHKEREKRIIWKKYKSKKKRFLAVQTPALTANLCKNQ